MNRNWTRIDLSSGAVVAITGGARGIGYEAAKQFHAQGAKVVLGDLDEAEVQEAAARLGDRAHGIQLDVTDRSSFSDFLIRAEEEAGPVDVLVNNAGIMPAGPFLDETDTITDAQIDVNIYGPMIGMRLVLPRMLERRKGHIVNVASMAGKFAIPGLAVYSATKFAVVGLSAAVRDEISGSGVTISTVMPNAVRTELTRGLPTERMGLLEPEDVAEAIVSSLTTRREEVAVPRWYGIWPIVPVLLPTRLVSWVKRVFGVNRLLDPSRIDHATRDAYDARAAEASSRSHEKTHS